ncbi:unnamed protein product, partial [marine sediment metagenome]
PMRAIVPWIESGLRESVFDSVSGAPDILAIACGEVNLWLDISC